MRAGIGVVYWVAVGLLALFALYVSAAGDRPWIGLLIPALLALLGLWWPGPKHSGAGLIVFGAYPALLITRSVGDQIVGMDWSCSEVAFDGIDNLNGGTLDCTVVSMDLILFGMGMWTVALLGAVLLYRQPQIGDA